MPIKQTNKENPLKTTATFVAACVAVLLVLKSQVHIYTNTLQNKKHCHILLQYVAMFFCFEEY